MREEKYLILELILCIDYRKPLILLHLRASPVRTLAPTLRTEKDIGSENPGTTAVSGFFRAIFQGAIQKISFPKNDLWGGLELYARTILGLKSDNYMI